MREYVEKNIGLSYYISYSKMSRIRDVYLLNIAVLKGSYLGAPRPFDNRGTEYGSISQGVSLHATLNQANETMEPANSKCYTGR